MEKVSSADAVVLPLREEQFRHLYGIAALLEDRAYQESRQLLLAALLRETAIIAERQESIPAAEKRRVIYICDVVRHIGEHYQESLTAEELARFFYVSVAKLNRDFRYYTQTTVREMLIRVRLQHAVQHLECGRSVTEAALSVGFTGDSHFIRSFRKYYGTTPYQYVRTRRT